MDPGTIVSIVELSTSVLKLGYKVHLEFFGHETSVGKLQHFNGRLQLINDALEDIVEDSKTGATHSTESFKGIPQLQATLQEGKDFLSRFDKTLGGRSKTQRIQFITGVGEKELDNLNAKVDRHYQELQYWSSRNISRQFRTW